MSLPLPTQIWGGAISLAVALSFAALADHSGAGITRPFAPIPRTAPRGLFDVTDACQLFRASTRPVIDAVDPAQDLAPRSPKTSPPKSPPPPQRSPDPPPDNRVPPEPTPGNLEARVASLFKKNGCTGCHDSSQDRNLFHGDGRLLDSKHIPRLLEVLNGENLSQGTMRKIIEEFRGGLSDDEAAAIQAWAHEKGHRDFSLKTLAPPQVPPKTPTEADEPKTIEDAIQRGLLNETDLIKPEDLAQRIERGESPTLWSLGDVGLIKGATDLGVASTERGLEKLKAAIANITEKSQEIILYCGCCSTRTVCPNVARAFNTLRREGFTRIRILDLEDTLDENWKDKGYPMAESP